MQEILILGGAQSHSVMGCLRDLNEWSELAPFSPNNRRPHPFCFAPKMGIATGAYKPR